MKTLLRPLLFSAIVVSMLAPAASAFAQRHDRYNEGYFITIGPTTRRVWHNHRWAYMHRRHVNGAFVWRY